MRGKLAALMLLGALFELASWASDWPSFRGPNGAGVAREGAFPDLLDPAVNLTWKVDVPPGKSSPVFVANRILLTGHDDDQRFVLCYDAEDGSELWRRALKVTRAEHRNKLNDPAAPTVATDGERVFSFFADFGLVAHTLDGRELWRRPLGPFENQHGVAASPIYTAGKLFLLADQSVGSYLAAFDPQSGDTIWEQQREDVLGAYSTPVRNGSALLTLGPGELAAYSTDSGRKLWWVTGLPIQPKAVPVIGDGLVFVNVKGAAPPGTGATPTFAGLAQALDKNRNGLIEVAEAPDASSRNMVEGLDANGDGGVSKEEFEAGLATDEAAGSLRAIRLGGVGDVTGTHAVWRYDRSLPDVPSPLLYDNVIYNLRNGAILTALEAETGRLLKQGRLPDAIDSYYASPVAGDGKVYALSETGKHTVIRAGEDWEPLGTSELGEDAYATPALARESVFVRSMKALYRFGDR